MTIAEVQAAVAEIGRYKDSDPERAHSLRDALMIEVVKYACDPSEGCPWDLASCPHVSDVANEALKALDVKLRWESAA